MSESEPRALQQAPWWVPAGAQASFAALASSMAGRIGMALAPLGHDPIQTFGSLQIGHAWSTMKVPVLVTVLRDLESEGQELDPARRQDAAAAIQRSDNATAAALFASLEEIHGGPSGASMALQQVLRLGGDEDVVVNTAPNPDGFTTWGQTEWSAAGQVAFYSSLARGRLLSPANTSYVMSLMSNVVTDQRWGAGAVDFPGPVAFKGGWGPEPAPEGGYLVRQSAIVGSGIHGYVFSMLAQPGDGSFPTGTTFLSQIAHWVARTFTASGLTE